MERRLTRIYTYIEADPHLGRSPKVSKILIIPLKYFKILIRPPKILKKIIITPLKIFKNFT